MKRLSERSVTESLLEHGGNMARVAEAHGVSRSAVCMYVNARENLKTIKLQAIETRKDVAEDKLQEAVRNGEAWAICFTLKCLAKDRGYVERQELTGPEGTSITYRLIAPQTNRVSANGNGSLH